MIAREPERRFQTAEQALQSLEYADQDADLTPSYDLSLRREEAKRREFFLMFLMFIATMTTTLLHYSESSRSTNRFNRCISLKRPPSSPISC